MNKKFRILLFLLLVGGSILFIPNSMRAANSPFDVPSNVQSGWNSIIGGKTFKETTGRDLIYDIYNTKYIPGGYEIVYRNYGRGSEPFIHFTGWSVLFGHKRHTTTNHDTYIAAVKTGGSSGVGTQKVYGTIPKSLSATEDLEYNNQGAGVYNECSATTTNTPNDTCNMRYDNVGFDAYLPMNDLFPNSGEKANWSLYIVKRVDSHIVYTPLILPFQFDDKSFNSGLVSLTSGQNTRNLIMNSDGVLRRSYPREIASSVINALGTDRYFTNGQTYTQIDSEETQTAIWYGVPSPKDGGAKKWAATAYWTFGGTQAKIYFEPPPNANFNFSPSTIYNDTTVQFTNTSSDPGGDPLTYQWAYQTPGSTTWTNFSTAQHPTRVLNIKGTWNIRLTVTDTSGLTDSVVKSPVVSNRAPVASFTYSPSTLYNDTTATFTNSSWDSDGDSLTYQWYYQAPGTTTWTSFSTAKNPTKILNDKKTWGIKLVVTDSAGATDDAIQYPYVSNRNPVANFTYSPTTIYNDTTVTFTNSSSDPDGDPLTYQWAYQTPGSSTWVDFSTAKNPTKVLNIKGTWDIRLTVKDDDGATHSVTKYPVVVNRAPIADFTWNPTTIYNDTTVTFTNRSTDPDGDTMTYQWAYQTPGSTTWVNFSTAKDPTKILNLKGTWKIRLTTTDVDGASHSVTKSPVVINRPPTIIVTYTPTDPYEGDTMNVCVKPTDADKDPLTVKIFIKKDGGTEQLVLNKSNVATGTQECYQYVTDVGRYDVRATVHDGEVEVGTSTWFYSKPLIINGYVNHTDLWKQQHAKEGNLAHQFYSGEKFLLDADTSPYPTVYVKATLIASRADNSPVSSAVPLAFKTNILYTGELYDETFLQYPKNLKVGPAAFEFEVKYTNGVIKKDTVNIEIIADSYKTFLLHRRY